MDWTIWLLGGVAVAVVGLVAYWQLIITEGTYLGAPLVALLYDWTAERYNSIKEFDRDDEDFCLGLPLESRLSDAPAATIIDVAAGTGRVTQVMLRRPHFAGRVIGVDRSFKMLAVAQREAAPFGERAVFIQADAMALPFAGGSAPAVTCLEALEFFPSPERGLAELARVLAPAEPPDAGHGWLLTTRRIGWEAKLMPGKTWSRAQLQQLLQNLSFTQIQIQVWQDIYDLVWAQKQ